MSLLHLFSLQLLLLVTRGLALSTNPEPSCRRRWIQQLTSRIARSASLLAVGGWWSNPLPSIAASSSSSSSEARFRTQAAAEYTNSITASRDTNVSPKEAYDSILQYLPKNKSGDPTAKALDMGAGAGLSTSYLYDQLGYKDIDAVDWSGDAWRSNVLESPPSVRFYELDDDSFYGMVRQSSNEDIAHKKYQIICYNFAINPAKAVRVAKEFLDQDNGVLFAPINDRAEYWYKQTYFVLNARGQVLQKSGAEVGAWSVQFQPDVTSSTCSGIWCGDMNGFNQKRAMQQQQKVLF